MKQLNVASFGNFENGSQFLTKNLIRSRYN